MAYIALFKNANANAGRCGAVVLPAYRIVNGAHHLCWLIMVQLSVWGGVFPVRSIVLGKGVSSFECVDDLLPVEIRFRHVARGFLHFLCKCRMIENLPNPAGEGLWFRVR